MEVLSVKKGALESAKASVDAELAALDIRLRTSGPSAEEVGSLLALATELHHELPHLTPEQRRAIVDMLDVRIRVERDEVGRRWAHVTARLALDGAWLPLDGIVPTTYSGFQLSEHSLRGLSQQQRIHARDDQRIVSR
jgi:hypothetical protein